MNKKEVTSLVDTAAELDNQIKELETKIKPLKEKIKQLAEKDYTESELKSGVTILGNNAVVKITGAEKREEADPETVFNFLLKRKLEHRFIDVVKIEVKSLSTIIGDEESKKLRPVVGLTLRQSFSKR